MTETPDNDKPMTAENNPETRGGPNFGTWSRKPEADFGTWSNLPNNENDNLVNPNSSGAVQPVSKPPEVVMEEMLDKKREAAKEVEAQNLAKEQHEAEAKRLAEAQKQKDREDKVKEVISRPFTPTIVFTTDIQWRELIDLHAQGEVSERTFQELVLAQGNAEDKGVKEQDERQRLIAATVQRRALPDAAEWDDESKRLQELIETRKSVADQTEEDRLVFEASQRIGKFARYSTGARALHWSEVEDEIDEVNGGGMYLTLPYTERDSVRQALEARQETLLVSAERQLSDIKGAGDSIIQALDRGIDNLRTNKITSIENILTSSTERLNNLTLKPLAESPLYRGIRKYYYAQTLKAVEAKLADAKTLASTIVPEDAIMAIVRSSKPAAERLTNVEKLREEKQLEAVRVILGEIEDTDFGIREARNGPSLTALEVLMGKDSITERVRNEVEARLHLHACFIAVKKINSPKPEDTINGIVSEIGKYALKPKDLDLFLVDNLEGLAVPQAFSILQREGYAGTWSGKKDQDQAASIRDRLVTEIYNSNPSGFKSRKDAEISYDLAMKVAEATFEKYVWDISGQSHVMANVIYFDTYRQVKNKEKGPEKTRALIPNLATSYFRELQKLADKSYAANNLQWQQVERATDFKEKKYRALALRRIETPSTSSIYTTGASSNITKISTQALNPATAEANFGLKFDKTTFHGVDQNSYVSYLQSRRDVFIAENRLLEMNYKSQEANNVNLQAVWAGEVDKIDPLLPDGLGLMGVRYYMFVGVLDSSLNANMEADEADEAAREAVHGGASAKGFFRLLPPVQRDGTRTIQALLEDTNYMERGKVNARINTLNRRRQIRK